ncbi:Signal recognition particle subunit SRP72 [Lamellibrachia satsuma]|nr:Signal recognition particle subunit SRP72 [Lamellibrachia satsuma]
MLQLFEDDPDVAEDEVDAELSIIRVQLGYTLQELGRSDEALKLYSQVLKKKPSDAGLAAVASNNVVTINKEQNVFDSKKKIKTATADGLQQKLTSKQRQLIEMNHCLLTMYMNQGEECRRMAERLRKTYSDSDTPTLIEAAQYWREKQVVKATELLTNQIAKREGDDVITLKLTLAQLYLGQGHVYQACDMMSALGACTYMPGMVAALVMLYTSEEVMEAAKAILQEAIEWHRKNKPKGAELVALMRASVRFHLKHNNPQAAAVLLEDLRKRYPNDLKILAKLISAYSKFDSKKAQTISRELPSVEDIAQDVDVDSLESSMTTLAPKYIKKLTKGEQSPKPQSPMGGGDTLRQQKKKKKRKTILPKSYDPEVTPDPERWLKRQERSYFRGKRRDKRKEIGKGTQGSVPTLADKDAAKPSSASNSEVGSPQPGVPTPPLGSRSATTTPSTNAAGPRKQKPQGGKQKKKKKGGKW